LNSFGNQNPKFPVAVHRLRLRACVRQRDQSSSLHHRELLEKNAAMNLSPHLRCEEEAHSRGKILRFAGEADFLAVPAVRQLLKKLLRQRIPFLIVDLSGVTFLNTPFWAAMQRYQIDGHPNSRLALCGMNEALKAAFDINGVGLGSAEGGCIAVYETLDSALAAAPSAP